MQYPGGKNAAGTFQRIISQIPPHRVYIEPFAGSAAVLRHKLPSEKSIALDRDSGAIAALREEVLHQEPLRSSLELVCGDGLEFLDSYPFVGDEFVYCDPPYMSSACASRCRYRFGFSAAEHRELLRLCRRLPCAVMISGYDSPMYERALVAWRLLKFTQMTRGGWVAEECQWMNYPEPAVLHDYRYVGKNFREREKFRRRQRRWAGKLARMSALERGALLAALALPEPEILRPDDLRRMPAQGAGSAGRVRPLSGVPGPGVAGRARDVPGVTG